MTSINGNNFREAGNGYFQNRIRNYIQQYHPDLLDKGDDFEGKIKAWSEDTIDHVLTLEKEGFQSTEAIEQSLARTLESISSPIGTLRDFIIENEDTIQQLTGISDVSDRELLLKLLPLVHTEIETVEFSTSPSDISDAKAHLLRKISLTLLQRN